MSGTTTTGGHLHPRWRLACVLAAIEYLNAAALLRAMLDALGLQRIEVTVDSEFISTNLDGPSLRVERRLPATRSLALQAEQPHWVVDKPVYQSATRWEPSWTDVVEVSAHRAYADACQALVLLWVEDLLAGVREDAEPPFPSRAERVYLGWEDDDDE